MNYRYAIIALIAIVLLIVPASANIVGVTWNQSNSSPSAFSSYWGANYAPIAAPDFNNTEPWASMGRVNNSATQYQTMVQVKKHYYRTENITPSAGVHWMNFSISDVPATGYTTDPWHVVNGTEVPWAYIGAFEASTYNVSTATYNTGDFSGVVVSSSKLSSVAGMKPTSGNNNTLTLPNFRTLAQNRGTGWELNSMGAISTIERLYIIEYRYWNAQSVIGSGVTQISSGTGNMALNTGLTAGIGANSTNLYNSTGAVSTVHYSTGQKTNEISYRGVENFYGNIWKWVDGINIKADRNPWIADHDFASNVFAHPYIDTGLTLPAADGYISNLAYGAGLDYAFLPPAVAGSSTTYLCDYYYQATGNRAALFGGAWAYGATAGAFDWDLSFAASYVSRSIGARVAFTPPLYSNFTYNSASATVSFTDHSFNISTRTGNSFSPVSWNWSFGDGSLSTSQNPTHTFPGGNFTVNLTVSDGINYETSLQQVTIILSQFTPSDPIALMYPNGQAFTDTSTGSPTAWNWMFMNVTGNNTQLSFNTTQNATFFAGVGNYTIALNASTSTAFNISTQLTWVNVSAANVTPPPPTNESGVINHSLGRIPNYVLITVTLPNETYYVSNVTSTNFTLDIRDSMTGIRSTTNQTIYYCAG